MTAKRKRRVTAAPAAKDATPVRRRAAKVKPVKVETPAPETPAEPLTAAPVKEAPVGKPVPRKFTKQRPCNKKDIWNCFRGPRGFVRVETAQAKSVIGVNAPRVMLGRECLMMETVKSVEYYALTDYGKEWLTKGIVSFIKNHADEVGDIFYLPARLQP